MLSSSVLKLLLFLFGSCRRDILLFLDSVPCVELRLFVIYRPNRASYFVSVVSLSSRAIVLSGRAGGMMDLFLPSVISSYANAVKERNTTSDQPIIDGIIYFYFILFACRAELLYASIYVKPLKNSHYLCF